MTVLRRLSFCIAMIVLSGCVTQQQYTLQGTSQATNTGAAGVRTVAVAQGPVKRHIVIAAGSTARLASTFSVNPDCTFKGYNEIRVLTDPAHGTAIARHVNDFPDFPANNPRSACNSAKVQGVELFYTPDDDFTGVDFLTAIIITSDGKELEGKFAITVK